MTAREILDVWVIEYSPSQRAIHVHQIDEAINGNIRMIFTGNANDYLMVGVAMTAQQAHAFADVFQRKLRERRAA